MKIVLISPYDSVSCIGLRYISSILKKAGYDVILIFMLKSKHINRQFNDLYTRIELQELAKFFGDDCLFVGLSVSTNYLTRAIQISEKIRSINKAIPIVWGGIHPTVLPEASLSYCDYVCIGEGELSIVQFAKKLEESKKSEKIKVKNFWYRRNKKLVKTGISPLIRDLDELPLPDFFLEEQYVLYEEEIKPLDTELFKYFLDTHKYSPYPKSKELPFHTSRGCPYSCTFCCNSIFVDIYGATWHNARALSPSEIVHQLSEILNQHDFIKLIFFSDDDFLLRSVEELQQFSDLYKKKIGLPFRCYFTPATITETKFRELIYAGLYTFSMGIQSGSDRTNKEIYRRSVTQKQVIRAINIIDKFKELIHKPVYHIIEDNPFENGEDICSTKEMIKMIPTYWRGKFFSLTFYPGTELYEMAIQNRIIKDFQKDVVLKDFEKCYAKESGTL